MAYSDALLTIGGTAMAAAVTHVQWHTGDPGPAGTANVASVARVAPTKSTDADGDTTYGAAWTGGPASSPFWGITLWSAAGTGTPPAGGTFYGAIPRTTGDTTSNAAGAYTFTGTAPLTSTDA